jgi:hypothetical protein
MQWKLLFSVHGRLEEYRVECSFRSTVINWFKEITHNPGESCLWKGHICSQVNSGDSIKQASCSWQDPLVSLAIRQGESPGLHLTVTRVGALKLCI